MMTDEGEVQPLVSSLVQDLDPEELSEYLVAKFGFKVEDIRRFQGICNNILNAGVQIFPVNLFMCCKNICHLDVTNTLTEQVH